MPRRRCRRLIEACKRAITADRRSAFDAARARAWPTRTARPLERARAEAAYAWDASPISTARLTAELWAQIKNEDWALVAESGTEQRLVERGCGRSTSTISSSAAPAARASATARRRRSAPRWRTRSTAACRSRSRATAISCTRPASGGRRRITRSRCWRSMHNNRAYHQEVMHVQRMANRHNRGITRAHIGTTLDRPEHRLREDRAGHGGPRAGTDHQSQRSGTGDQTRDRGGQTRRAVADRRRHAATVGDRPMKTRFLPYVVRPFKSVPHGLPAGRENAAEFSWRSSCWRCS